MSSNLYLICVIIICAAVTVFTRSAPFILFGTRKLPPVVSYLGSVLPPAIMIILVCYCLRNIDIFSASHGLPELISCAAVVIIHLVKKNMYISIIVGTVCYMILIRVL